MILMSVFFAFSLGKAAVVDPFHEKRQFEMSHRHLLPQTVDYEVGPLPESQFMVTRDSDRKNSQDACLWKIKQYLGSSFYIWSLEAKSKQLARGSAKDRTYQVSCKLAFFHDENIFRRSVLSGLESRLNYVSYLESEGTLSKTLPKLMGHFTRDVSEPFFHIEFRDIEPNPKAPPLFVSRLETMKDLTYDPTSVKVPILTGQGKGKEKRKKKLQEVGVLIIPFEQKQSLRMSFDRDAEGRNLAAEHSYELALSEDWLKFPKGFKWGIASSSFQIEGGNTRSDWYRFEQIPGKVFQNDRSDDGPDHWNRIEEDIALLKKLGVQQYRMSMEWSRIEPREGVWNEEVIQHYRDELQLLKKNKIEPIITLWHSTLPIWVSDKGGWEWDGIVGAFEKFAQFSLKKIAPDVKIWATLNEPFLFLLGAYVKGAMPPGKMGGAF